MRERIVQFMVGRNGNDHLNRFLIALDLLFLVLAGFFSSSLGRVLYPLFLILLFIIYFRMFSRDLFRRQAENEWYLQRRNRVVSSLRLVRERWVQRKDYCFFNCPSCRTTLRVPKGRGKIKIVCRKCGNSFVRKT